MLSFKQKWLLFKFRLDFSINIVLNFTIICYRGGQNIDDIHADFSYQSHINTYSSISNLININWITKVNFSVNFRKLISQCSNYLLSNNIF